MIDPLGLLTGLVIEDGRAWGDAAADLQLTDAAAVLAGDQSWHAISRARGWSKTTDLAGIALAAAVAAPDNSKLYWAAADLDQAKLGLDSIRAFRDRTPALQGAIEIRARSVLVPATETVIEFLPADAPGSWGLRPYLIVCDELAQWPETPSAVQLWEALTSAVHKVKDARLVVITTAGSPSHWAAKVFENAREDDAWRVSETSGPPPWSDPEKLAAQRRLLPEPAYLRLFENVWTEMAGAFLSAEMIEGCFSLDPPTETQTRGNHFAGLDVGLVNDRTGFVIGHREGDEVHLDLVKSWQGSKRKPVRLDDVQEYVYEAWRTYRFRLKCDPWQAVSLIQALRHKGVRVDQHNFSQGSKAKLAQTLLQSVSDGTLHLFDAEGLRDELLGLRLREMTNGQVTFDHRRGKHDDMATALALMTLAAVERSEGRVEIGPGIWGPQSVESARYWERRREAEADPRRRHGAPGHRQWSMQHVCRECRDEWEARFIPDPKETHSG
jgi:phage terminase large subunit-like protein